MKCKKCGIVGNFEIDHRCGGADKCTENCRFRCKVCGWLPIDMLNAEGRRF